MRYQENEQELALLDRLADFAATAEREYEVAADSGATVGIELSPVESLRLHYLITIYRMQAKGD